MVYILKLSRCFCMVSLRTGCFLIGILNICGSVIWMLCGAAFIVAPQVFELHRTKTMTKSFLSGIHERYEKRIAQPLAIWWPYPWKRFVFGCLVVLICIPNINSLTIWFPSHRAHSIIHYIRSTLWPKQLKYEIKWNFLNLYWLWLSPNKTYWFLVFQPSSPFYIFTAVFSLGLILLGIALLSLFFTFVLIKGVQTVSNRI